MKLGLGQSYDRVRFLNKKTRAYIDLTQPASSIGATVAFFLASLFFFAYHGEVSSAFSNYTDLIYASATIFLAHAASQVMNQSEDAEMDAESDNKNTRPIPSGIVSEDEARSIAWILSYLAFFRSFLVSVEFGVMVSVSLFFGIFYNLRPIRAKSRIISIPWQAVSRGLLSFPLVWAAYGDVTSIIPWALGVVMFFYTLGYQNTADLSDIVVDRKYGIKTVAAEYGVDGVLGLMLVSTGFLALSTGAFTILGVFDEKLMWLVAIVPYCGVMYTWVSWRPLSVSGITGNHPAYLMYYFGMVGIVILALLTQIL